MDYGYLSGASSGREGAGSIWYSLLIKLSVKAYGKEAPRGDYEYN